MKANVKIDTKGAVAKTKVLKKAAGLESPSAIKFQLTKWGGLTQKFIIRNVSGGIIGKYKGGTRSGQLRRSIKFNIRGLKSYFQLEIGSFGVKYSRILEKGGVIYPKRKQWLTVPLPGVKGWARNYPNAFIIKSKKGNLLIVEKKGKAGIKPLFVLKKSVRIPAFRWLEKSVKPKQSLLNRMLSTKELLRIAKRL